MLEGVINLVVIIDDVIVYLFCFSLWVDERLGYYSTV